MSKPRKKCRTCSRRLAISRFNLDKKNPDGFRNQCRACEAEGRQRRKIRELASELPPITSPKAASELRAVANRNAMLALVTMHRDKYEELVAHHLRILEGKYNGRVELNGDGEKKESKVWVRLT